MSSYTLELRHLHETYKVFSFDYDFYTDSDVIKNNFEKKFIDEYYFNEIGMETVARFQHRLKTRLNKIMPYYKQLYQTELKSNDIDFMLNKDLIETFERTIEGNTTNNLDNTSSSNMSNILTQNEQDLSNINELTINSNSSDFKESNIDNGNASLELSDGSITNVNKTDNESNNKLTSSLTNDKNISSNLENSSDITSRASSNEINTQTETTQLTSKGNIGVTSSAELLEKWRKVLINIDELIINECSDLFMMVY